MARYDPHWDSRMPAPYTPLHTPRRSESVRSAATGDPVSEADARRLLRRMDLDADVVTVVRRQASTSHVRDDLEESERVARKSGVKRVTTRTVRHVTTVTRSEQRAGPSQHYYDAAWSSERYSAAPAVTYYQQQAVPPRPPERSHHHRRAKISDIMVGQDESLTAKEALLRWAQRTTAKYPGVRVKDFTSSWKDGLAFNAIIHRNRPDLVDWRSLKSTNIRERLDSAFHVVEREYGVTRLLDPEDVDTPEPDEKSLITYISSLYDVFPNPPALHPLYDPETQRKYAEYRELATALHTWIRDSTALMQDRHFPNTLMEVKKLANESNRFRTDEVPARLRVKQHVARLYKDIEKFLEETEEKLEPELRPDVIERNWNQLLAMHQERDAAIHKEMERLERLQRIAEKVHREAKQSDARLDDVELRIDEEAKRLDRLHPRDAKHNCDAISKELAGVEETINGMFADVQTLKEGRYMQTTDLHKRVQRIHQRWMSVRAVFQTRLMDVLPSLSTDSRSSRSTLEARLFETNEHFRYLRECSDWVRSKLTQLEKASYGNDLPSVQVELESHVKEHKSIEKFHVNIDKCISNKNKFQGEESSIYLQHLNTLQKSYSELTMVSHKRLNDLEMLQDFIQSATTELIWLNEKEEVEISRDWSSKSLNVAEIQRYYEALMSELERREIQVSAVQDRGEALILQHHPASKTVEAYMTALQTQWHWLLQLTLCLETHMRHAAVYHNFFQEVQKCEKWFSWLDEQLNSTYSQSEFTLDEGEKLLKEMQDLRENLTHFCGALEELDKTSCEVVALKQRRQALRQPVNVTCICNYKQVDANLSKDEVVKLVNNANKTKWKVVTSAGVECQVPSVCIVIPPPDPEATEAIDRLKRHYDRCENLWLKKQMRMSQNMIFATIKVVKSWDLSQFMAMGKDQRDAIRKALNEDAEKLLQQGDPNDPQLRRLQREIDEVNQLFDEFERRAAMGNRSELSQRAIGDQLTSLLVQLEDAERTMTSRITAALPRDLDQLEQLVVEHKQFEMDLQQLQPELESAKQNVEECPRKTPSMQTKLDSCITKWNAIWQNSQLYIERLKGAEVVLNGLDEATKFVSRLEIQLASSENMPSEPDALRRAHDDLVEMQNAIHVHQGVIDQLSEEVGQVRHLVAKSRSAVNATVRKHPDVDRLEGEVKTVVTRWSNICTQVVERLQSCETTFELLEKYAAVSQVNHTWIESVSETVTKLPPVENGVAARAQLESTAKLYNGVAAKRTSLEDANMLGARLMREAKSYRSALEEFQPSWDGIARRSRGHVSAGEYAARDLDDLNARYEWLVDALLQRIDQLHRLVDDEFDVGPLPERPVLRTYHDELHLSSSDNNGLNDSYFTDEDNMPSLRTTYSKPSTSPARRSSVTTVYIGSEQQMSSRVSTTTMEQHASSETSNGRTVVTQHQQTSSSSVGSRRESLSTTTILSSSSSSLTLNASSATTHLSLSSSPSAIQLTTSPSFANPKTGQQLTLVEAIETGLLDPKRAVYIEPKTGNALTLSEAATAGYVDPVAAAVLQQSSFGVRDPRSGHGLSLMQAIQMGLYDVQRACFVHPQSGEPIGADEAVHLGLVLKEKVSTLVALGVVKKGPPTLFEALHLGWVDFDSGFVTVPQTGVRCSLHEAVVSGLVSVEPRRETLSLYEALSQGLIDCQSRTFTDCGQRISFSSALDRQLIDAQFVSVVSGGRRFTLEQAIDNELIDVAKCQLKTESGFISLDQALRQERIVRPVTLRECVDANLVSKDGTFVEPVSSPERPVRYNLLQAIQAGLLDSDRFKSIVDSSTSALLTLGQALAEGILLPSGRYVEKSNSVTFSIEEANIMGFLLSDGSPSPIARRSSISTELDPPPGGWPLKEAIDKKLLDAHSGLFAVPGTDRLVSLEECIRLSLIRPDSASVLDPTTNHFVPLLRAFEKRILSPTGQYKESVDKGGKVLKLREAINRYRVIYEEDPNADAFIRGMSPVRQKSVERQRSTERQASVEREASAPKMRRTSSERETMKSTKQTPPSPTIREQDDTVPWEGLPPPDLQDIRVVSGVIFAPSTGTVTVESSGETLELLEAIKRNVVQPAKVKVRDPSQISKELSIVEAIRKGIISKETGEYKYAGGRTLSLTDSVKIGVVIVNGRPASEPEPVEPAIPEDPNAWKNLRVKLVDPLTGAEVTWESALERRILDAETVSQFANVAEQSNVRYSAELVSCIVLSDVTTGKQLSAEDGLNRGVVNEKRLTEIIQEQKPVPYRLMDTTGIPLGDDRKLSLAQDARSRITMEPKFSVAIGRARSLQQEGGKLQRIRRRVMKPREAAVLGLVDAPTGEILDAAVSQNVKSIESFLKRQNIDAETKGAICDVMRCQHLTFREALDRGILEDETGEMQFPIAASISVAEAVERGLYDQRAGCFIHPENGSALTLAEAIECEIIDPLTPVLDTRQDEAKSIALSLAIATGLVNGQTGEVMTERGPVALVDAVLNPRRPLYQNSTRIRTPAVPPVGLSLPVAMERKLIDPTSLEMLHPATGRRIALQDAINTRLIMSIPVPVTSDCVQLVEALEQQRIDLKTKTFTETNGRKTSVVEALERGSLAVRIPAQFHGSSVASSEKQESTETVVTRETLVTRTIHLTSGFTLIGSDHVKNEVTGRLISLRQAGRLGLVVGVEAEPLSFQEAVAEGLIHLASGTFTRPATNERLSINQALKEGLIYLDGDALANVQLASIREEVTAQTLIFDVRTQRTITVQQAIRAGLLTRNGDYIQESGETVPFIEAARLGLIAILGVPVDSSGHQTTETVLFSTAPIRRDSVVQQQHFRSRRTSIQMALKEERLASHAQLVLPSTKKRMSVDEAIREKVVTPSAIISMEEDGILLIGEPLHRIPVVDILDKEFAVRHRLYDEEADCFIEAETNEHIRVADAAAIGILDGKHVMVKDVRCNTFVTLDEALEKNLMNPDNGHVTEPKTNRSVPFYEAVSLGWIEPSPEAQRAKLVRPLSFKYVVEQGWYSPENGIVNFPMLKASLALSVAIQRGLLDSDSFIYRSIETGEDLTLVQASKRGLIDSTNGTVRPKADAKPIDFPSAVSTGVLQPKRKSISLEAAIRSGRLDTNSGRLVYTVTRKSLNVEESIQWGLLDPFMSEISDPKRKRIISLEEAIADRLVDSSRGRLLNTATGQWLDFASALKQGLIGTDVSSQTIFNAIDDGLYDAEENKFFNPYTGDSESLGEALNSGLIDGASARVQQPDGSFVSLKEACHSRFLDGKRLDEAVEQKIIVPLYKAWSLQEALAQKLYDRDSGLFKFDGSAVSGKITLLTAIQKGLIKKSALTVKDPRSADVLTLGDAIQAGIIDPTLGIAVDPSSGAEMDLITATERGLIITAQRKLSVTEALRKGLYDSQSGRFSVCSEGTKPKLPTEVAIRGGLIDSTSNLVRSFKTGGVVTFQQAVDDGLIDLKQGTLRASSRETIDFQQALDRGLLIEVQRPLFLSEAMVKEVFNEKTGLFLDPLTGQSLTIAEAIESGLIDPESVHVKDTRSGFLRKISLSTAIELDLVNGHTAVVSDLTNNTCHSLSESFKYGLLVDSKTPISIQRMIHQGMYDEETGRVVDPNTGNQITIHEALRRCVLHPLLPCYFDRDSGRPLSLAETCRNGIIDRRTGQFRLPQSKLEMPLNWALEREYILDIERPFSLYDALHMGFFDEHKNCFVHPTTGRNLNLDAACKEQLVHASKSIVKHAKTGRFMKLDEAIEMGLVDPERNVYVVPDRKSEELTLLQAMTRKLIVTSRKGLTLADAIYNGLYTPETGKFVDPSIGDQLDLSHALEHDLVDGATTAVVDAVTGNIKSLKSAIESGEIDGVRGRYIDPRTKRSISLEAALEQGIIQTVDRALTFDQAVRGGAIDLKEATFVDPRTSRQCTLEEAIRMELIDPESAVIKDPRTGRFTSVKRAVTEGVIDLKRRALFDPQTGRLAPLCIIFEQGTVVFHRQPVGFEEAIEQRQLDLQTARLLEQNSREELTLKEAVALGCIDPDSVMVRDNLKKHFVKLSYALEVSLVDAEHGLVLNNASGQQVTLPEALDSGLLITPKRRVPIIEAIEFNVYKPETGRFVDPFSQRSLTLRDALDASLLDSSATLAKDPHTGRIFSFEDAIIEGLIDAETGSLAGMNLVDALAQKYILTAEARVSLATTLWLDCIGLPPNAYTQVTHTSINRTATFPSKPLQAWEKRGLG